MLVTMESLGIDRLTVRERLDLVEQILNSLPDSLALDEIPAWHFVELARRRAEANERPGEGRPWREVLGSAEGGL